MSNSKKCYAIGDISDICNVPIKTLRYYDEIGLLVPSHRDPVTNYRYYSEDQMLTLYIIRKLKVFGFTLEKIRSLVYGGDIKTLSKNLSDKAREIHEEIEELSALKSDIEATLERIEKGSDFISCFNGPDNAGDAVSKMPAGNISIEYIPQKKCIYTRKIEENYQNANVSVERWFEIFSIVKKYSLKSTGVITLTYHNEPLGQFFKKDCDLEVSTEIADERDCTSYKTFGGYDAITAMHVGSHGKIINTHIKALKWISQHNYEVIGPISEEYIVSPIDVKNENEYLTKIIIPVKSKKM